MAKSLSLLFLGLSLIAANKALSSIGSEDIIAAIKPFMAQHLAQLSADFGESSRVEYDVKSLDPRLALADCPTPLNIEKKSANRIGRINLNVSCPQQKRWSIYVPIEVNLFKPVVVSIAPIAKGTTIEPHHLELREMNVGKLNGTYFSDDSNIIGMQAKRPIKADKPLIAQHLEPPVIIKRGESVLITAQTAGLVVKIPAIALRDGRKGQQISVKNKQSNRIVDAIVRAPGQVSVTM